MAYPESQYNNFQKAKTLNNYGLDDTDHILTKQEDGRLGYLSAGIFATTGSNTFTGDITINGDIHANQFIITTSSVNHYTASTNFGLDVGDTHTFTGSVYITGSLNVIGGINGQINATNGVISSSAQITAFGFVSGSYETTGRSIISSSTQIKNYGDFATTGSNTFNGNETITGSLFVSGTTELGGNIVPKSAMGATLGTLERPFSDIFVSSGSINIASDIPGDPNTTLTNIGGNILVSAGGMRLLGDASFIAATGSFQYLSGSFTHIGSAFRTGDTTIVGNQQLSGSLTISGSGFINNRRILTDLDSGSYAITGSNTFSGSQGISGSLYVSESLNITDGFYVNGNKQFNYGQFSDTTIQSGSANTAYSMKFNTTDIVSGFSIVSGSRITAQNTGIYNLQFSAQFDVLVNENAIIDVWFAINGSNVPNSNTSISINKAQAGNEGKVVAAWNILLPISASQYAEIKWNSNSNNVILLSSGSTTNPVRPAIPSVIATMTQIA